MFEFSVQFIFLMLQFLLESENDVADFFLNLEFYGVDVVLDGVEVLLFLLLPFEQTLDSLYCQHLSVYFCCCFFLPLQFAAEIFDAFGQLEDAELVAVVALFISVAGFAVLAEEGPALAAGFDADGGEGGFFMLGAGEGQAAGEGIFKHLNLKQMLLLYQC